MNRIACALLLALAVTAPGCSDNNSPAGTGGSVDDAGVVRGVVIEVNDDTPSDGGVMIDLRLGSGKTITAYLPSFYTGEPPPPGKLEAYEVIRTLERGDHVEIRGEFIDGWLRIESVTRLGR